ILVKAGPYAKLSSKHIPLEIRTKNPDAPSLLDHMLLLLTCYNLVSAGSYNGEDVKECMGLLWLSFPNQDMYNIYDLYTFHFKDLVLEGGNLVEKLHGMPNYQYNGLNPKHAKSYDIAMTTFLKIIVKKILDKYRTLVDVGAGYGVTLNMIISKYPSIKGINYDLPYVDDEHCLKLLRKYYEALDEKGKVIVISYMMSKEAEASSAAKFVSQMDLLMATEFGAKQFKPMAIDVGFSSFQLKCLVLNVIVVMELYK
ncbi:hypothetical protein Gogos_003718, partial [Gossypium gossypioides]|nr:hypothetical protein [Gossypium gossypioides]